MLSSFGYASGYWILAYRDFNKVIEDPIHQCCCYYDLALIDGLPNQAVAALK